MREIPPIVCSVLSHTMADVFEVVAIVSLGIAHTTSRRWHATERLLDRASGIDNSSWEMPVLVLLVVVQLWAHRDQPIVVT